MKKILLNNKLSLLNFLAGLSLLTVNEYALAGALFSIGVAVFDFETIKNS
jgi:hypothetical protein